MASVSASLTISQCLAIDLAAGSIRPIKVGAPLPCFLVPPRYPNTTCRDWQFNLVQPSRMDFVLSLSLILLLNSAGRFECSGVDDGTVPTPLLNTMEGTEAPPITKETIEKREVSSGFSSPDIEATKIPVPPAVDASTLNSNRTVDAEVEGTSRKPLIIDLGNLPSIRVRRSDSSEFTASMTADQGEPAEEDEYEGSSQKKDEDPTIQESAEDPANIREERKLESDEILEEAEQDQGRMFGGWYRHRSFAERRLQN